MYVAKVITVNEKLHTHMYPHIYKWFFKPLTSHVAIAVPLYSASVLDKAVGYFLVLHVITKFPKENINPLVDILYEMLPMESTSMYPYTCNSTQTS